MNIILGSGPASALCAAALLKAGKRVLMIDPGKTLEPEREAVIAKAQTVSKAQWDVSLQNLVRDNTAPTVGGLPKKLVYGSDFPFQWLEPDVSLELAGVDTLTSHALGGLSNAWGANIFPFAELDMKEWPISRSDLAPYYQTVLSQIPYAGAKDDLATMFPLFGSPTELPFSEQARRMLHRLERNRETLQSAGVTFGRSRLAVEAVPCVACGLCLYGCPYKLIYNSSHTVLKLLANPLFTYRPGYIGKAFNEVGDHCRVTVLNLSSGERETLSCERLYVGCGAVGTTALVHRSIFNPDTEVLIKDSQYFITPFVQFSSVPKVVAEELHTLSQLAVEIMDPTLCEHSMHLLFYTYNDMYLRALKRLLGFGARPLRPLVHAFLGRLVILQGYLHSDYSASLVLRREIGEVEKIHLTAKPNSLTAPLLKRLHQKVLSLRQSFGGVPLTFMSHRAAPGKSYHLGGSFPMSRSPSRFQTDLLGRPSGMKRVHIVDSSVFPTVPATNNTLTAMANAYRIGVESAEG